MVKSTSWMTGNNTRAEDDWRHPVHCEPKTESPAATNVLCACGLESNPHEALGPNQELMLQVPCVGMQDGPRPEVTFIRRIFCL